jgi:hypothetical protein
MRAARSPSRPRRGDGATIATTSAGLAVTAVTAVTAATAAIAAIAVGGAVLGACASAGAPSRAAEASQSDVTAHNEIIRLDGDIVNWRLELRLAPEPQDLLTRTYFTRPDAPMGQVPTSLPAQCNDVCILADYICQAADDICRIAATLPGDEWARGKCAKSRASCAEARRKCSDCARVHESK